MTGCKAPDRKAVRMGVNVREKGGKFYVFINHNGQRKAKCVGSEKAALKVAEKIEAKLTLGDFKIQTEMDKHVAPRLQQFYDKTLLPFWEATLQSDKTYECYEGVFRLYILPDLGEMRIAEISSERVEEFILSLKKKNVTKPRR